MRVTPYLTFSGNAQEAMDLYTEAFKTEVMQVMRYKDVPPNPDFPIPDGYGDKVIQAMLKMGEDFFIRMCDCGPGHDLKDNPTEMISIAIEEVTAEEVTHIFNTLAREGKVGMPLEKTFYSSLAGVVYDKFGVMWNLVAK